MLVLYYFSGLLVPPGGVGGPTTAELVDAGHTSAADFTIAQGDQLPLLQAVLKDVDGLPVNLVGSLVRFEMHPSFRVRSAAPPVDQPAVIASAAAGSVSYAWHAGETDTIGLHQARFRVTFPTGQIQSFPSGKPLDIQVLAL